MLIRYDIPIKTVSELNVSCHWAVRAKRKKQQRSVAYLCTMSALEHHYAHMSGFKHITITLTRHGRGILNAHDNLPSAFKACVDGIAQVLSVKQDEDERLEWIYKQEKSKEYYVSVEINIQ